MGAEAVSQELAYARKAWQELEELTTRPRQRQRAVQSWRFKYYAFKRKVEHEAEQDAARSQEAQARTATVQAQLEGYLDGTRSLRAPRDVEQAQAQLEDALGSLRSAVSEGVIAEDSAQAVEQVAQQAQARLEERAQEIADRRARGRELDRAYHDAMRQYQLEQERAQKALDDQAQYDNALESQVADGMVEVAGGVAERLDAMGYGQLGLDVYSDEVEVDENTLYGFVESAWVDPVWWRDVQAAVDDLGVDPRDYDGSEELYRDLLKALRTKASGLEDELARAKDTLTERVKAEMGPRPKADTGTLEEPQRADFMPPRLGPKPSAPAWPALRPAKGGLSDDLSSLLDQMDRYAYGAYTATYEHVAQINELAVAIGHDCPTLELVGDDLDLSALHSYLGEVESVWGGFAQGGAGNSQEGQAVISRFKDAVLAAQQARTLDELTAAKAELSTAIDRLYIWVTDRWYQFGGRPTQHKGSSKEKRIIKIKTAFGVISNEK